MNESINVPINKLKNIGPTIAKRLNAIGVYSLADLDEMTPALAYTKMAQKYPEKNLPICYYLYSLQGALLDMHWDDIPEKLKAELREKTSHR